MRIWNWAELVLLMLYTAYTPFFVWMLITSLAALFSGKNRSKTVASPTNDLGLGRRFLIAIPAHNEEADIVKTVVSCTSVSYPTQHFQVLVIADNCTDATADRARGAGARVLERMDATRKSKGYAIQYLLETLACTGEFDELDALVIVDADSTIGAEALRHFSRLLDAGADWIQCYDKVGNADESWRTRLMAYGFSLINGVTLSGQSALGLSAGLRGNGMCLSTNGLRRIPWNSLGLTEDLEYSWSVRIAGGKIAFAPEVSINATMLAHGGKAVINQRRRWEYGREDVKRKMLRPLLRSSHLGWLEKAAAVLELRMPTTLKLVSIYAIMTIIAVLCLPDLAANTNPCLLFLILFLHSVASLSLAIQAASPFLMSLLPWRFALSVCYLPYFASGHLLASLQGRPQSWHRTTREPTGCLQGTLSHVHAPFGQESISRNGA